MKAVLLTVLSSFAAGGLLVGYLTWDSSGTSALAGGADTPIELADSEIGDEAGDGATPSPTPIAEAIEAIEALEPEDAEEAVEAVTRVAEQQGGLDQRLAAAEQRLTRLDLQAQAAAGNAARAEALLIAFATRRVIERGGELGYLADQLRLRFGDERPNTVNTIINFSRRETPVRIDTLLARLEGLGPEITENDEGASWESFTNSVSELFVIRRDSTPSPQPEKRLERARYALEQGRFDTAIEEIRNMPGADKAEAWIRDAESLRDVMTALADIERAAVLDQRGLRDGAGNPVNQLSPAGGGS